jgi:Cellulase (glycosyl hydrolase family 5)
MVFAIAMTLSALVGIGGASGAAAGVNGTAVAIAAGRAVGVPAGDYLLTASGLTSAGPTYGEIAQQLGGTGTLLRTAEFAGSTTPQTVTAEVRVSGPADTFAPVTAGVYTTVTGMTLTPASWSYLARGPYLTTAGSANVTWHGINNDPAMRDQDYTNVAVKYPKVSIDRIMITETCWDPFFVAGQATKFCQQLGGSAGYQTNIERAVSDVVAHGEVALLVVDWAGRDDASWTAPVQTDDFGPDQHTLSLYASLARMYAGNSKVIFETTNEPKMSAGQTFAPNNIPAAALWLDGGPVTLEGITWQAPGVQQIVDAIRGAGNPNLVLAEGMSWGEDLRPVETTPMVGTNVGYSYHGYISPDNTQSHPPSWDTWIAPVVGPGSAGGYAAMLSEFGTTQQDLLPPISANGSAYLQSCITWTVNHGMGWAAWGWYPDTWGDKFAIVHTYQPLALNSKGQTVAKNF